MVITYEQFKKQYRPLFFLGESREVDVLCSKVSECEEVLEVGGNPIPVGVVEAAVEYIRRNRGLSMPKGRFVITPEGEAGVVFEAQKSELRSCCVKFVGTPKLFGHLRSLEHISNLFHVDIKELALAVEQLQARKMLLDYLLAE